MVGVVRKIEDEHAFLLFVSRSFGWWVFGGRDSEVTVQDRDGEGDGKILFMCMMCDMSDT